MLKRFLEIPNRVRLNKKQLFIKFPALSTHIKKRFQCMETTNRIVKWFLFLIILSVKNGINVTDERG